MNAKAQANLEESHVLGDPRERAVAQRFEAKYFITEVEAAMLRDYMIEYTLADRHGAVYPVTSMYLDNVNMTTYNSSLAGEKNRYKLRVRGYEEGVEQPIFTEVKQRLGRVIRKHRACLHREVLDHEHWDEPISPSLLVSPDSVREQENLMLFSELCSRLRAEPKIALRYTREAYVSSLEEPVRVTFDSNIAFIPVPERIRDIWKEDTQWRIIVDTPIVLEIKFTDSYPLWVRRMIQRFQLTRVSLAKYVVCYRTLQNEGGF